MSPKAPATESRGAKQRTFEARRRASDVKSCRASHQKRLAGPSLIELFGERGATEEQRVSHLSVMLYSNKSRNAAFFPITGLCSANIRENIPIKHLFSAEFALEGDGNDGSEAAHRAFAESDVAAVALGDIARDGEAEAAVALVLIARPVDAIERLEHVDRARTRECPARCRPPRRCSQFPSVAARMTMWSP